MTSSGLLPSTPERAGRRTIFRLSSGLSHCWLIACGEYGTQNIRQLTGAWVFNGPRCTGRVYKVVYLYKFTIGRFCDCNYTPFEWNRRLCSSSSSSSSSNLHALHALHATQSFESKIHPHPQEKSLSLRDPLLRDQLLRDHLMHAQLFRDRSQQNPCSLTHLGPGTPSSSR